ncbi:MAG TPA: hypothetical protein VMD59_23140, partial [Acidimicrobiales bacterium]|nr:hypothetical protein [Acidimicrobiales bacterium]
MPPHHVPRPRLVDRCADRQVVVVEAAAGYGKSVLGAELVDSWRAVGIDVQLDHAGVPGLLLAARLQVATAQAGFTGAAAAGEVGDDPAAAVDAIVASLAGERCAFVVDDAHHAAASAAGLIEYLACRLQAGQRLVVLCRRLPDGAQRLRRAEFFHLGAGDLAVSAEEALEICCRFGLEIGAEALEALNRATGGWTAATVLAASRAARTGEAFASVIEAASGAGYAGDAVAAILEEALASLGPASISQLAQIARLPLLDREVVAAATGEEGLFERAIRAGLPLAPSRGPWFDLPGPARDHLASLAPLDRDAMRRAAQAYRRRDQLGPALELLLASGDPAEAAAVLAETPPEAAEGLELREVRAIFDQLPDDVLDAHPAALLTVAYRLRAADRYEACFALAGRAKAIAGRLDDAVLDRAADVLLLDQHMIQLDKETAEAATRRILAACGPGEELTRARALQVLGYTLGWRLNDSGQRDEQALTEAVESFRRASNLFRSLGMTSMVSRVAILWAMLIEFPRGQAAAALERLEEALPLVANRPRRWAYLMTVRALVAADAGLDELCEASVNEVLRVAQLLNDENLRAQGQWKLAILASQKGDADATLAHLREAEQHRDTWWGPASGDFLAEAADLVDRVGHVALAREYLARVQAEPKDAGHLVALAEGALEARHGDPGAAEEHLLAASRRRIDPREQWRVTLLRAYAAYRRGEDGAAAALAAQSFEEAARLGQPNAPVIRERQLTEQLLGLAAATGQPAAVALQSGSLPVAIAVLGRFELTAAGRRVELGAGQEVRLLKLVALSSGGVHAEAAIETIWPDVAGAA